MELREIMAAFAAESGMETLVPDENGLYSISVDDMVVSFSERRDEGQLVTMAEVCEPPPETRDRLYRILMEAMHLGNATGGAMFSVAPDSEMICLQRFDALAALDLEGFKTMLGEFVNVLEEWRGIVAAFRDVAPALDAAHERSDAERRQFGFGEDGFIRG